MDDDRAELNVERLQVNGVELAYLQGGHSEDPLVICLHGFPDSPRTFKHLAPALIAGGFRIAAPWLRGYPPSQVVEGPYQVAALARDAIAMADALSPDRQACLVGHDWGGLAAYGAAVLEPSRWQRIAVLSVPPSRAFRPFLTGSWDQQRAAWYQFLFQLEPLAETAVRAEDFAFIDRLWEAWSPGWKPDTDALSAAKQSIEEGFPAALWFYRDTWQAARQHPDLTQDQQHIMDGPVAVPALVLHGLRDGCILPGAFAEAAEYFSSAHTIEALAGVGHFLHLEDPETVNARILAFLSGASSDAGGEGSHRQTRR